MALSPTEDAWRSLFHGHAEPAAGTQPRTFSGKTPPSQRPFLFFRAEDQHAASALADEFDALAGRKPGSAHPAAPTRKQLAAVMDRFHAAAANNVSLAQAALRVFIVRWPHADVLPMPTLRQQLATLHKEQPKRFSALSLSTAAVPATATGEDALAYYRQDLDLSDHHLHWHNLYRFSEPVQGMQGRLFLYMHQQMLARYNTERLAVGLQPVVPFLQWDQPQTWESAFQDTRLPADPLAPWITAVWIKDVPDNSYIGFEEGGTSPEQNDASDVKMVLAGLQRVYDGIQSGTYQSYDAVGADLEASSGDRPEALGAGPHNAGHMALATPPNNNQQQYFVMAAPEVAMTTPVFYRWHRAIDDFGFAWQQAQGPDNTEYVTPPVVQRRGAAPAMTASPDIILTPRSAVAGITQPDFDLEAWGETQFGGTNFDAPADTALNLTELVTELSKDPDVAGLQALSINTDWVYFLRLRNVGDVDATVTVRIWLAALELANDRRNWIEMDKFVATVPAGADKVLGRGSWQSTVVRRKSVDAPMTLAATQDEYVDSSGQTAGNMWCECGLPYRLLLPRGTAAGMPARFLILLTDAQQDGTADLATPQCGSVLYCGRNDQTWPDNQEMGFPFHRPFAAAGDPVFAHFDPMPNAAWRDVSIRCVDND